MAEKPKKVEASKPVEKESKDDQIPVFEEDHDFPSDPELIDWRVHEATISKPLPSGSISTSQVIREILSKRSAQESSLTLTSFKEWQETQWKQARQTEKQQKDEFVRYLTKTGFFDAV